MSVKLAFSRIFSKHADQRLVGPLQQSADSAHKAVCLISDIICRVKDGYNKQW